MIENELSKTVNIQVAGTLHSLITEKERKAITNLTIIGIIDARDLFFIRDNMPEINTLDIMSITILSYEDNDPTSNNYYSANHIPSNAFHNCRELTNVTIPIGIISIGDNAFSWCTGIKTITIPNTVTFIAENSFSYCYSLQSITVESANLFYTSLDGVLFDKNLITLIHCPSRIQNDTYIVPKLVTSIGNSAFIASRLQNIILSEGVKINWRLCF